MKKAETDGRTAAISFSADGRYLGNIREDWRLSMKKSLALVNRWSKTKRRHPTRQTKRKSLASVALKQHLFSRLKYESDKEPDAAIAADSTKGCCNNF
jgi:hypothetical protein